MGLDSYSNLIIKGLHQDNFLNTAPLRCVRISKMQETGRSLLTINDGGCIPKATKRFAIMKHRLFMLTLTYRNGIIHKKAIG